jgi:glycosyltransferase involved in cell wall biosynthesis
MGSASSKYNKINLTEKIAGYLIMKNICVISPLGYTGIAYYDFSLCYALTEVGLQVELFSVDKYVVKKEPNFKRESIFINTFGNAGRLKKGINYLKAMATCYRMIIKNKYSMVHFQKLELPIIDCLLFLLLKLKGVKIVYTPHDILPFKYKRFLYPISLTYALSDGLIVHNEQNSQDLIQLFGIDENKISIIPHGNYNYFLSDIHKSNARALLALPQDKMILLLFGNIRAGKGIETTIEALNILKDKNKVMLLIAGKVSRGFDLDEMMSLIKYNKLEKIVLVRNEFINDELVEAYYKSSDIAIVPYEQGYESGVLKYAFSCGIPVVISDLKEFSEFSRDGETCFTFRAGDHVQLADKLQLLLDNETLRKKISLNAKKLSDTEWHWESSAFKTRSFYEKISTSRQY